MFEKIAFGGILGFRKKEEEGDGDGDDGEEKNDEEQGNTKLRGWKKVNKLIMLPKKNSCEWKWSGWKWKKIIRRRKWKE